MPDELPKKVIKFKVGDVVEFDEEVYNGHVFMHFFAPPGYIGYPGQVFLHAESERGRVIVCKMSE